MALSNHAKFQLITTTRSRLFRTVLSRFCGRHYWSLFRKLACELAEVTSEAHLKSSAFTWFFAAGNLSVLEERFPANCLLHGFEIFLAAAVMTSSTCVVQCHNSKSNHRAGMSLHRSPASGPAMGKEGQCSHSFTVQISTREAFLSSVLITSRTSFSRGLFMSQDPRGRSCHYPFQLRIWKKNRKKKHNVREQGKRYLILKRN